MQRFCTVQVKSLKCAQINSYLGVQSWFKNSPTQTKPPSQSRHGTLVNQLMVSLSPQNVQILITYFLDTNSLISCWKSKTVQTLSRPYLQLQIVIYNTGLFDHCLSVPEWLPSLLLIQFWSMCTSQINPNLPRTEHWSQKLWPSPRRRSRRPQLLKWDRSPDRTSNILASSLVPAVLASMLVDLTWLPGHLLPVILDPQMKRQFWRSISRLTLSSFYVLTVSI